MPNLMWPVPQAGPFSSTDSIQRDGIIFRSAARIAAAYNSPEYVNLRARGIRFFINATIAGGGTLDMKVQNYDTASSTWIDIPLAAITQITATGTATLTIYPGETETSGVDVATPLGVRWRVVATVGTATTTFSVGADYIG